jgi:hypothetical protein
VAVDGGGGRRQKRWRSSSRRRRWPAKLAKAKYGMEDGQVLVVQQQAVHSENIQVGEMEFVYY